MLCSLLGEPVGCMYWKYSAIGCDACFFCGAGTIWLSLILRRLCCQTHLQLCSWQSPWPNQGLQAGFCSDRRGDHDRALGFQTGRKGPQENETSWKTCRNCKFLLQLYKLTFYKPMNYLEKLMMVCFLSFLVSRCFLFDDYRPQLVG